MPGDVVYKGRGRPRGAAAGARPADRPHAAGDGELRAAWLAHAVHCVCPLLITSISFFFFSVSFSFKFLFYVSFAFFMNIFLLSYAVHCEKKPAFSLLQFCHLYLFLLFFFFWFLSTFFVSFNYSCFMLSLFSIQFFFVLLFIYFFNFAFTNTVRVGRAWLRTRSLRSGSRRSSRPAHSCRTVMYVSCLLVCMCSFVCPYMYVLVCVLVCMCAFVCFCVYVLICVRVCSRVRRVCFGRALFL